LHPDNTTESLPKLAEAEIVYSFGPIRKYWYRDAACQGAPLHLFFPSTSNRHTEKSEATASAVIRQFCRRCPVEAECLIDYLRSAKVNAEFIGIRGGFHFDTTGKTIEEAKQHLLNILTLRGCTQQSDVGSAVARPKPVGVGETRPSAGDGGAAGSTPQGAASPSGGACRPHI
jgi:hypothetical protein